MPKTNQELESIRSNAEQTEKRLKKKQRERKARKKEAQPSINERLIAPVLLIITMLISYLILLFN